MIPNLTARLIAIAVTVTIPLPVLAADRINSQTGFTNLQDVLVQGFQVVLSFLAGIATLYLILSGYRYIVAQGNPDMVEKAKKSLTYAVFGVILAYASVLIIYAIAQALGVRPGFDGAGGGG